MLEDWITLSSLGTSHYRCWTGFRLSSSSLLMSRFGPIAWSNLIWYLRQLGFGGPYVGSKREFIIGRNMRLQPPNPHQSDVSRDLLTRLLQQARISPESESPCDASPLQLQQGSEAFITAEGPDSSEVKLVTHQQHVSYALEVLHRDPLHLLHGFVHTLHLAK